jgi:hypothetical protein
MDRLRVNKSDARKMCRGSRPHWLDLGLVTLIVTSLSTLAAIVHR